MNQCNLKHWIWRMSRKVQGWSACLKSTILSSQWSCLCYWKNRKCSPGQIDTVALLTFQQWQNETQSFYFDTNFWWHIKRNPSQHTSNLRTSLCTVMPILSKSLSYWVTLASNWRHTKGEKEPTFFKHGLKCGGFVEHSTLHIKKMAFY